MCYNGTHTLSAYSCRKYSNIVNFAHLNGGFGNRSVPDDFSCGQNGRTGFGQACRAIDFGTWSNRSVPCAIAPEAPPAAGRCDGGKATSQPAPFNGVGTAAQPAGQRFLLLDFVGSVRPYAPLGPIGNHPDDVLTTLSNTSSCFAGGTTSYAYSFGPFTGVWWEHGAAALTKQLEIFFTNYAAAGGQLDELTADWESVMFGHSHCPLPPNGTAAGLEATTRCLSCLKDRYNALEADPRWPAAKAELLALGFVQPAGKTLADVLVPQQCVPTSNASLRLGMADCATQDGVSPQQAVSMVPWHAWLTKRETDYWAKAILPSAQKYFPNVRLSFYDYWQWDPEHCTTPSVSTGFLNCQSGKGAAAMTVSAPVCECRHAAPIALHAGSILSRCILS
eukprot:COSAG01_NODE_8949_length_2606_cov_2.124850_2_plen_392_part_00